MARLDRSSALIGATGSKRARSAAAFGIYLALAVGLFSSAWANPTYLSVGEPGDAEIYMWMLGWVPYSIIHGLNPLFSDFVIYPQGASLFWSLIPIVPGLLLGPLMAWLGPVVTYNATMTLGLAGSAWCAYLLINTLIHHRLASWIGGLLYGFSPYMQAHSLGHPNLVIGMFPPLLLLTLVELLVWQRRQAWLIGGALGVLSAVQLLTTPEILFTSALIASIGLLVLVAMKPHEVRDRMRHAAVGAAVAVAVFAVLAAAPLAFFFLGPQQVHGVVREQDIYVTDLVNFIVPTKVQLLAPAQLVALSRQWTGDTAEANAYIGVPLLVLLGYTTLRHWSSLLVRWCAVVAAITAVLSLGPHLHEAGRIHFHIPLPWLLVQHQPLFDNVLPARLMLFFYLLAGVAVGFLVNELLRRPSAWPSRAGLGMVALALIFLLPAVPWPVTPNPVPAFFSGPDVMQVPAGSVALVAPFSTAPGFQLGPGQGSATYPMLWQQASGMRFRMPEGGMNVPDVNGRPSGGRPPQSVTQTTLIEIQQGGAAPFITPGLRAGLQSDLTSWKVKTVIVGPMYNQGAMVDFFDSLIGRPPLQEGGVYVWWDVGF